jgi:hypothetical protein
VSDAGLVDICTMRTAKLQLLVVAFLGAARFSTLIPVMASPCPTEGDTTMWRYAVSPSQAASLVQM